MPDCNVTWGFSGDSDSKGSTCNTGDPCSIPGLGRSPGEGNGHPLQCSFLENPMDRGALWATVHGIAKSGLTEQLTLSLSVLYKLDKKFSSVHFSHSVVSDSLQSHEPQHARPSCSLPTPGVHPNPCPLCQ